MNKILISLFLFSSIACTVNKGTKTMHPYSGDSVACGNFIVYKLTEDNTEFVSVIIDASSIELEKMQAYSVGKADVVSISRKKYAGPVHQSLCNDVMMDKPNQVLEEDATEGLVELIVSEENMQKAEKKEPYRVTLVLKKVTFDTMTIDYLRLENIIVGWLPG